MNLISTRIRKSLWVALAAGLVTLGSSRAYAEPSDADQAQARDLFREGMALREKGDLVGAAEKLKAAHAVARTPITSFELGKAYLAIGKLVEAREVFLSVSRIPQTVEETERSKSARTQSDALAEQIRTRIPTLRLKVTGVPVDSVAVTIDGAMIPKEALEAPRYANAGSHIVSARSTTGASTETRVDLREGESRDVELKLVLTGGIPETPGASNPAPALATSAPEEVPPRSHALEWSLIGAGAAVGIAGGVLMEVAAVQSHNAVNRLDRGAFDSAKTLWTAGLVGVFVGGVTVVSGGIIFALPDRPSASSAATRPALWLRASLDRVELGGAWQ